MFKRLKKIIGYLWELPQNLIGLYMSHGCPKDVFNVDGEEVSVYYSNKCPSGISLGKYIILKPYYQTRPIDLLEPVVRHEHGHQFQSRMCGPFYLFAVGIPSLVRNITCRRLRGICSYYNGYPEKQADMYGGVDRRLADLKAIEYYKSLYSSVQKDQNLLYYKYNKRG